MDSNSWVGDVTVLAGLEPCGAFCQGKSGALCQLTDMSLRMQLDEALFPLFVIWH